MARAGSLGVSFQSERYRDQSRGGVKVGINLGAVPSAGERRSGGATVSEALRIANCSGFYGDRFSAAREMLEGGPIDVLTGEYLAELTIDRKSTRLNSSHSQISYAVFCLKKKNNKQHSST